MRGLSLLGALIVALIFGAPARASVGTTLHLGAATQGSGIGTTLALQTSQDCPGGSFLFVGAASSSSSAGKEPTAVADKNTSSVTVDASYTATATYSANANEIERGFYVTTAGDLPLNSIITITFAANSAIQYAWATCTPGVGAMDQIAAGFTGTGSGTQTMFNTGTLAQSGEIIFVLDFLVSGATDTFTEDATHAWTATDAAKSGSAFRGATQVVGSTSVPTYSPGVGATSRNWVVNWVAFKPSTGATPAPCFINLIGVGRC